MNSWEVRRASDRDLFGYIHNGISGTTMPAFALADETIRELAAYVRSLNSPANSVPVTGDAQAGEAVFSIKGGCSGCHMIRGHGGYLGPDLSEIGAKKRLEELRHAILRPNTLATDGYRAVILRDMQDKQVRAIVKRQSNWSMAVLDEGGHLRLLRGAAMQRIIPHQQWMPENYAQVLTADEVQDLIAYLSRQSLRPPSSVSDRPNARVEEPN